MQMRALHLDKGEHKHIFRYAPGNEEEVIDAIMQQAEDPNVDLDWMDAAALGFQVTRHAARDCRGRLLPTDITDPPPWGEEGFDANPSDATDGSCDCFQ